jgi:predicted Fe-Mo cluster-binding NifX family protein
MVEEYLVDAVFIKDTDDQEQIALLKAAGIKVIALPEEPVDQIIGMMLYSKLSAVMEGCMLIRSIMLSSTAGDNVIYEHDAQESVAPFDQPGWWNEPLNRICEMQNLNSRLMKLYLY